MLVQNKLTCDYLFAGIWRHGVNPGQVGDECFVVPFYASVFAVYGDSGEITYSLAGARELIKKSGLSAVLIAGERKGHCRAFGQRCFRSFHVVFSAFAQPGVRYLAFFQLCGRPFGVVAYVLNFNLLSVCETERQFIAVYSYFYRIAHRRVFHHSYVSVRYYAHIQKVLTERTVSADSSDGGGFAYGEVF